MGKWIWRMDFGVWRLNLVWRRSLFEWEKTQVCQLLEEVHGMNLISSIEDKWSWKGGGFSPSIGVGC